MKIIDHKDFPTLTEKKATFNEFWDEYVKPQLTGDVKVEQLKEMLYDSMCFGIEVGFQKGVKHE